MKHSMKLTKREIEISSIIYKQTREAFYNHILDEIGYDAMNISLDLLIDRANVSRILNKLCRLGILSKIIGRPTLYISKEFIREIKRNDYIPEVFPNQKNFITYFDDFSLPVINRKSPFHKLIGYQTNESLHDAIKKLEASILYPPYGLPMMIWGESGTGKKTLANCLFEFAVMKNLLKNKDDLVYIDAKQKDCSVQLDELFSIHHRKRRKMLILNAFDQLKENDAQRIKEKLIDKESSSLYWVLLSSSKLNELNELSISSYVPSIVELTPYYEKTIKEKFAFVLALFQNEANVIQRTIRLNKNIINCFVMSNYFKTTYILKKEIRLTLALTLQSSQGNVLEINLANISDNVLIEIRDINNHIDELYRIYSLIDAHNVHLIPNEECHIYNLLRDEVIYNTQNTLADSKINDMNNHVHSVDYLCKKDIKNSLSIELNQFNSMNLGDIYGIVYPMVENELFVKNEKLLYGLLSHLVNVIEQLNEESYQNCTMNSVNIMTNPKTIEITSRIQEEYHLVLPEQELLYIQQYINLSEIIVQGFKVCVLFLCSSANVAKNYAQYANVLKYNVEAKYLDMGTLELYRSESKVKSLITTLDSGKGILILSDDEIDQVILDTFSEHSSSILSISNVTIHQIPEIMRIAEKVDTFLEDFSCFSEQRGYEVDELELYNDDEVTSFIDIIRNEIFDQSLTFLNPQKIIDLSICSFKGIINDLKITYSEILVVKFIVHTAFMAERVIRGESLTYKKINDFIRQNSLIFHVVEKNTLNINNQLGIKVPQSEIVYLTEIFLAELNEVVL